MSEEWMPFWAANFFEIALSYAGQDLPYIWTASPHRLDLCTSMGQRATFAFVDSQTIIFEAHGVDIRFLPLKPYKSHYRTPDGIHNLVDAGTQYIHQFAPGPQTRLQMPTIGTIEWLRAEGEDCRGVLRLIRHESFWTHLPLLSVEEAAQSYARNFDLWRERMPAVPEQYHEAAEKALFLLWNCQVPKEGSLTRRAIFSNKASMNAIWSWDNCFHALAVAEVDPELAWDQLLLLFDLQAESGALPDVVSDNKVSYGYTKPPIYGWTVRKLIEMLRVTVSRRLLDRRSLHTPGSMA